MKDLFVLAADADMQAVFRALLDRPDALGIQPISSFVDRHVYRDPGVFTDGPEFVRRTIPKNDYQRCILAFDYHGSGCNRQPDECATTLQERLDSFTFKERSAVIVIAPELEEWLWRDPSSITINVDLDAIPDPEERLRLVFKRKPLPRDFERIALRANLQAWESSPSFRIFKTTLQNWFQ
jgi:hypothetical protein